MKNTFIDSTWKLQLKLTGNVAATQLDWTCSYYDKNLTGNAITEWEYSGVSNNTTAVDICLAPASGHTRTIKNITVYNADTQTNTVVLQLVDGWGTRVLIRNSLTTLASWSADDMSFYTDISGKLDTTALSDTAYWAWWDGDTTHTATKNAVYDKIETLPTATSTTTFTNKRITKRVTSITSHATPTVNTDDCDCVDITAQAEAITNMSTNLSGTPTNKQMLIYQIKDDWTARAITWWTSFVAGWVALPSTTVLSKILTVGFIYNTANSLNKRQCIASAQE